MSRNAMYTIGVILLLVAGYLLFTRSSKEEAPAQKETSFKDATYTIEGQQITLTDGISEIEIAPGSASRLTTRYFGNEAMGDLNGDGVADIAFLLTQEPGGSGTFYYVVAAVKTDEGYEGSDAVLLGDRVAPQTTEIRDGKIIVNYADRRSGEAMTTQPSEGKTKTLFLDPSLMVLGEIQ